jgi:hypothetical protein
VSLLTGYAVDKTPNWAAIGTRAYLTNDFDRPQVWDGVWSAMVAAGIAAPSSNGTTTHTMAGPNSTAAGSSTIGTHLFRYRYVDSKSPAGTYRSNPSGSLSYAVVSAPTSALTFTITAAGGGGNIIRSADTKVDTIVVEMTLASGSTYYVATTCANSATSVTVNISDTSLAVQDLASLYDETGHEQPPIASCILECRRFTFVAGSHSRTRTVTVTNGSASVTGTVFSTLWANRFVRFGSDTTTYEISSATTTTITLTTTYAGSSGSTTATIFSKYPNRLYWSKESFPESFSAATRARDVLNGTGDRIVGLADFYGDIWTIGLRSMSKLVFRDEPSDGEENVIPGNFGIWNQRCLIQLDGALYGWGPNGVWTSTGGRPRWLSRPCDTTVAALLDTSLMDQAHACYDPIEKRITWWFCRSGDTHPKDALELDLTKGRWSSPQWRQGIDASVMVSNANGKLLQVVSDSTNGMSWYGYGATDGVPSTSTGSYTTSTGSTTTVVNVVDSLPTGAGTDLTGTILYRVATGEMRAIASNTSSAITAGSAFTSTPTSPAAGEAMYVGAIPWSITTGWWTGDGLQDKKRAMLQVQVSPSTAGEILVYLYRDKSATPVVWTTNGSTEQRWPKAITAPANGQSYLAVSLNVSSNDGFVSIPMNLSWSRMLRAKVVCLSPAGTLRLLDVNFSVESKRDEKKDVGGT